MKNELNFSFDVGMTSLGVAVNKNNEVIHADVLRMHPEAGAIKAQAERRRQYRTREAHKSREAVLESLWESIGKKPLQRKCFTKTKNAKGQRVFIKTKADNRLEREFPGRGDETVYTSCLLRIMLLEGKVMEDWQIYKALHASIQRRGYDSNVPWKTREEQQKQTGKEENPEKQVDRFNEKLQKMTPDERYHLPCYYDAWKMGLWDAQTKKIIHIRQQSNSTHKARKYNASRVSVTNETKKLLSQAAEQIQELKEYVTEDNLDQLLYGEQRNALDKRYPSALKIDGLLGQKYPRFENRIIAKCALIPRLNVCKSEKPLAIEVGFLLRLVNWRYEQENERGVKSVHSLTSRQINDKFNECCSAWNKKSKEYQPEEYAKHFKLTPSKVAKMADSLGGSVKEGHQDIPASRHTGRSRFSQPALYLMKSLILSEKNPTEFHEELSQLVAAQEKENPGAEFGYQIFPDVPYKYFDVPYKNFKDKDKDDFKFLEKMAEKGDTIYVPDMSLAERYIHKNGDIENGNIESAIQKVISSCNWPELRHRLNVFRHELENLTQEYGKPDAVHLEFIREDFLGKKKKSAYTRQLEKGRDARKEAIENLKKLDIAVSDKNILRFRLYVEQNMQCLYTGKSIDKTKLESYDIDHIFPQGDNGPDAYYNKVLTSADVNRRQKGNRLPCECDFINWPAFKTRLKDLPLGKNKKKLLLASTREDTEGLIEKYTGLSGTAHIARLARDIVCLRFGWQPGAAGEQQRILVVSGGLTSKVAKKYDLYKVLGDGSKRYQKDRSDDRHHALDAMVISYLRQWARDKNKTEFFKFPKGIDAQYFAEKLSAVYPHYITRGRPAIAEQPKPQRNEGKNKKAVNVKKFKNISKDPDERGQWYTNKTETKKGTSQHGYLFYKNDKEEVRPKTIHSFRSPYKVQKEMEKKASKVLGLFYRGQSIHLSNQNQVKATQLGRVARLVYGEYEVIKINKQDVIIGHSAQRQEQSKDSDSTSRYRIKLNNLKKIGVCNELMRGKSFNLDESFANNDKVLSGNYRVDDNKSDLQNFVITEIQTRKEESVGFAKLVNHLSEKNWGDSPNKKDIITIDKTHNIYISEVKTDGLPGQKLPDGWYQIKKFQSNGKEVNLVSQNGTAYWISSKVLEYSTQEIR